MSKSSRTSQSSLALVLSVAAFFGATSSGRGQTPAEVNKAIDDGIGYLILRQRPDGHWEDYEGFPGGITALATLALLSCDVPADDAAIKNALAYLRGIEPQSTYVVALQTMVFAEASAKRDRALISRNAHWLMRTRNGRGLWSYGIGRMGGGDNSNTQYALLGLQAAAEAGVDIPEKFWEQCRRYWQSVQSRIGAWGYGDSGSRTTGSMTVAGISSLVISNREALSVQSGTFQGQRIRCAGAKIDKHLKAGIEWMGRNFRVDTNPSGAGQWLFYYLYGLERAGRLTGRRFLGDHDWYREGVRFLTQAAKQRESGAWDTGTGNQATVYNTAFALLFLSKGRIPILVNKAKFGRGDDWNNAPNDIHNLTRFMAATWKVKLNWQIVDLQIARVEDLLQAPVLAINGHEAPRFSDRQKILLRRYIEQGGLLMVDANCSVEPFDEGFRQICAEIFPEPGQELRRLEPEHGVWSSLFDMTEVAPNWPLYGINVGCRTGLFYSPLDLSCQWEHHADKNSTGAYRLGANIIAYATGPENLLDKLERRKVYDNVPEDDIKRNYLQIAKLRHNGDWNPAPRAITNLLAFLHDFSQIDVVRQQRDIDLLDPNLSHYPLCYMQGRTRFLFNRKEKEILAEYLALGGVLFADACCGSERFDEAFRALIAEIFPEKKLQPIPLDHEMFTQEIHYNIQGVELSAALGGRKGPPVLEGIEIDGRYAVIYSKYDIGCALECQQSRDCRGYTHESALKIASNIVLYALMQ